jgi:hypothetical protein
MGKPLAKLDSFTELHEARIQGTEARVETTKVDFEHNVGDEASGLCVTEPEVIV